MTLLRTYVGGALRTARLSQSRSLREVAKSARVSLGYLSEVERGQKEPSSELLNSICDALGITLTSLLSDVALSLRTAETPTLTVARDAA